jgi:hypothetical protein
MAKDDGVSDGDETRGGASLAGPSSKIFKNSDQYLREMVPRVAGERKALGLEGLVGGLEFVVVNVEPSNFIQAVREMLDRTGYDVSEAFRSDKGSTCVLKCGGSADILVTTRAGGGNPFSKYNNAPKSAHLPGTRLETFAFEVKDMDRYFAIQAGRGVRFAKGGPAELGPGRFIQTIPSRLTDRGCGDAARAEGLHGAARRGDGHRPGKAGRPTLEKHRFP